MGDIIVGNWDRLYEFGGGAHQADVTAALRNPSIRVHDQQRLVVLMQAGKVIDKNYTDIGQQTPLRGEVAFDLGDSFDWVITPAALMQVTTCHSGEGGGLLRSESATYYLLTPVPAPKGSSTRCWQAD